MCGFARVQDEHQVVLQCLHQKFACDFGHCCQLALLGTILLSQIREFSFHCRHGGVADKVSDLVANTAIVAMSSRNG